MKTRFKHALIIGASSGIGAALVRQLASEGCRVAALARREDILRELTRDAGEDQVIARVHDVTAIDGTPALFQEITRDLGGLDLVIYAAGVMRPVAFDEFNTEADLEMIRTNFEGAVAWLNPAAERFGALGRGCIVGIGSVAGDRGRSGNPAYGSSKAALHTYLEAHRNRIARKGVRVVTIKPGFVDTEMIAGIPGLFWVISPEKAARIILKKASRGVREAYVPARWRLVMAIIRRIPSFIFRHLKV